MADRGGVTRVLAKLEKSIEAGDYYEAHQMYRSVYARYAAQNDFDSAILLVYTGSTLFFKHGQTGSAGDLAVLMLDAYTAQPTPLDEKSLARIAELFSGYKEDHATRDKLVRQSLKWSTAVGRNTRGDPSLHHLFGTAFWREHNYQLAESHLVLGTEASALSLAEMLLEWSQKGSPSELELFITRAVLKYLELGNLRDANVLFRTFTAQHPSIRNPPFRLPLLNFCHFLLATLERDAAPLFKMLREKYRPSLQRDASFDASLDAIGQCFFNIRSSSGVSSMPGISEMLRTMLGS